MAIVPGRVRVATRVRAADPALDQCDPWPVRWARHHTRLLCVDELYDQLSEREREPGGGVSFRAVRPEPGRAPGRRREQRNRPGGARRCRVMPFWRAWEADLTAGAVRTAVTDRAARQSALHGYRRRPCQRWRTCGTPRFARVLPMFAQ